MLPPVSKWSSELKTRISTETDISFRTLKNRLESSGGSVDEAAKVLSRQNLISHDGYQDVVYGSPSRSPSLRLAEALITRQTAALICEDFPELGVSRFQVDFSQDVDELQRLIAKLLHGRAVQANLIKGESSTQATQEAAQVYASLQSRPDNKIGY